jgi:hypothetical protein
MKNLTNSGQTSSISRRLVPLYSSRSSRTNYCILCSTSCTQLMDTGISWWCQSFISRIRLGDVIPSARLATASLNWWLLDNVPGDRLRYSSTFPDLLRRHPQYNEHPAPLTSNARRALPGLPAPSSCSLHLHTVRAVED